MATVRPISYFLFSYFLPSTHMRAEIETLTSEIEQSLRLLRRSL
jgi:hypothetical protein